MADVLTHLAQPALEHNVVYYSVTLFTSAQHVCVMFDGGLYSDAFDLLLSVHQHAGWVPLLPEGGYVFCAICLSFPQKHYAKI